MSHRHCTMEHMFDMADVVDPVDAEALAALPTERLEAEMQSLAGHLAAATCAFLSMVAEFDRRDGAAGWECLSTAHWLNWRCGVGMCAAREQVRVARRLGELPLVRAEFAGGRLSYSKVRAITRVAHPDIEAGLVDMAQSATAAQMDQACRALRRTQDLAAAEAELEREEAEQQNRRQLSWHRSDDGELVIRARLGTEDAETVLAALRKATLDPEPDQPVGEGLDQRRADALVDIAAAYLANPTDGEAATPEIVVHLDLHDLRAYEANAGPHDQAHRNEQTDRKGDGNEGDQLDSAEDGEVQGGSGDEVDSDRDGGGDGHEHDHGCIVAGGRRWPVTTGSGFPLSFAALERLRCETGERLVLRLPDGSELNLGRHRRTVTRVLRRALMARDRHCRFPGCHRTSRLRAHHIIWWSRGGRTDFENLLMLCPKHHHAVHEGGWTLEGTASRHTFTAPDRRHIDNTPPLLTGSLAELRHLHQLHGRDITLDGAGGRWHGDHIDWDCFFAAFAN